MLHLDCSHGVSGDMLVGALIDLGADFKPMKETLSGIAKLSLRQVTKAGIQAKKFDVKFVSDSRSYTELLKEIDDLDISNQAKTLSKKILHSLAMAESRVHKTPLEQVHLHEARDSIVDAVAFSMALEGLGLLESQISYSMISIGTIAPATHDIIKNNSFPTKFLIDKEIATPTGMAILAAVANEFSNISPGGRSGHGAGTMDLPHPNVLKATLL
ncbi:MAG: LarC family nickel insertion protein [Candidatus Altiarchaeales archaeon]|nr:LarC family nickel insertion protein [Candidatus Altiarchaeota archaeon]MCG2783403.1 LarC family nickel insertion protein [Candidatus Altiarchaeales archaeon]MBU4266563.1 LarC family nickel insertion protein [Candidatus Altiarchaeota archaeon]MBU4341710.1 LarC family nickel insertion protein [Candidatus Altiarchaeota archaeon]MBU4406977.1 LarC family nickel insertion protein [Candidatus Altiarchaeota archaeon]